MRLRTSRWLVPLVLVVFLLLSCSDGADDTSDTTLTPTTTVGETTTTAPATTTTASTTTTIVATTVAAEQISGSFALVNGTLIDGTGSDPLADGVVVINGGRIAAVGAQGEIVVPPGTPAVDVRGATMLPGFINAHVHGAYSEDRLRAWAQAGVTTVRDLGAGFVEGPLADSVLCEGRCGVPEELFAFRDQLRRDPSFARLVAVGPFVTAPWPESTNLPPALAVTAPEEAGPIIDRLVEDGADVIKVYVNEPTHGSDTAQDTITAMVEVAHKHDIPVTAHVLRRVEAHYALNAGADDLAHMIIEDLSEGLIAQAIQQDTYWVPTLELWHCIGMNVSNTVENLRRFSQAGGNVALGTDYFGWWNCDWELGMPMTEIELMLEADMTPMQIIVAATNNGAHVCGLADELGTLEAGKIADILVVAGNPLEDKHTLTDVQMVIHNGVIIRNE